MVLVEAGGMISIHDILESRSLVDDKRRERLQRAFLARMIVDQIMAYAWV